MISLTGKRSSPEVMLSLTSQVQARFQRVPDGVSSRMIPMS